MELNRRGWFGGVIAALGLAAYPRVRWMARATPESPPQAVPPCFRAELLITRADWEDGLALNKLTAQVRHIRNVLYDGAPEKWGHGA